MKTKERLQEKSKVELFNKLYNTNLDCYNFDGSYNGITLQQHFNNDELNLLPLLDDKPTIYTIVRRVSPNGMSRDMSFFCINNGQLINITYLVSLIVDEREPKQNKYHEHIIRVNGAGMDMVFHMVYTLGNILFRDIEQDIDNSGYLLNYKSI